ncbi:hypothetical protein J6590_090362 [Homalodisca vitripennis]|nr:hypothetical protein J6590_090362 [Homalodisca vitripennis]
MFNCEGLLLCTIVCFLMATAMFMVMLGVLCCAPRARIGNTTVLLVLFTLLSVASAGNENEQPQPSTSTGGWTGADGAINLHQIQNPARPRSDPIPIPTTTTRSTCVIEDVFSFAPRHHRPVRRVEDYMEFCDEGLGEVITILSSMY